MVQIWELDPYPHGDPRLPHHIYPPRRLTTDELSEHTGALLYKINPRDAVASASRIATLKMERQFVREDTFILDQSCITNFSHQIGQLYSETEVDEEMGRFVLEGENYYDIKGKGGKWMRVLCEPGDFIVIPLGITHRFTTTPSNYVKLKRFYKY